MRRALTDSERVTVMMLVFGRNWPLMVAWFASYGVLLFAGLVVAWPLIVLKRSGRFEPRPLLLLGACIGSGSVGVGFLSLVGLVSVFSPPLLVQAGLPLVLFPCALMYGFWVWTISDRIVAAENVFALDILPLLRKAG